MPTQYTFTLRSGVTLQDAAVNVDGARYDVDQGLTAGGGSIVTTDFNLASALMTLTVGNLPLLDVNGVEVPPVVQRPSLDIVRTRPGEYSNGQVPAWSPSGQEWLPVNVGWGSVANGGPSQKVKTSRTVLMAAGDPLYTIPADVTGLEVDQFGSVLMGPNEILDRGSAATTVDTRTAFPDFLWDSSTRRVYTRMMFLREMSNPPNLQFGRFPGLYPKTKGITTLTSQVTLGGGTTTLNVGDTSGFQSHLGDTGIGEAILEDTSSGYKIGHVTFTGVTPTSLTGVTVTTGSGVTFSTATVVTDALKADTTIGIMYGSAWAGVGGFRERCAQISFSLRETAKPDANGDGGFHHAGNIGMWTSSPGPLSQRKQRVVIDEKGQFALLGSYIDGATALTRRFQVAGPQSRLRNSSKLVGAHTLPTATLTVRDTTDLPASGTVDINGQVVTYTGKTATTLTGASGGTGVQADQSAVVARYTLPVTTLDVDDIAQYTNLTAGKVNVNGQVLTYTGVDLTNRRLTGVTGGSGTIRGDDFTLWDHTSAAVLAACMGQISATDYGTARTVIGNVGPAAQAGLALGSSGDTVLYRFSAGILANYSNQTLRLLASSGSGYLLDTSTGSAQYWAMRLAGDMYWGGGGAFDTDLFRQNVAMLKTNGKLLAAAGLGVGNSAAATTPGAVVRKMEVFDAAGASLGFVPIHSSIT